MLWQTLWKSLERQDEGKGGFNFFLIGALSIPCVLGYNVWSWDGVAVFGGAVLDFEDFLVSNLFLPLGSLVYLLFCVSRYGWGLGEVYSRGQYWKGT